MHSLLRQSGNLTLGPFFQEMFDSRDMARGWDSVSMVGLRYFLGTLGLGSRNTNILVCLFVTEEMICIIECE